MKKRWYRWLLALFAIASAAVGYAEDDTLSALMQTLRSDTAVGIAYRETRNMALLDQPWQASGYLYSMPPDTLLKQQLQPEPLLLGIKGERMYYYDPVNQVRHRGELDEDDPLTLNIGVFKALVNADEALLRRLYRVEFAGGDGPRWRMTLKSKREPDSGFLIEIAGNARQRPDSITITQPDGDSSVFSLQQQTSGTQVERTVERLYRQLLGD